MNDGLVHIADRTWEIAARDPERVAMIHAHHLPVVGPRYERFTYAELSRRAESLAVGLRSIGVSEGSLCSFMVPPCFDSLVLGVALWRVGAVTVGIEPHSHGLRRVAKCLDKVGPEFFFGTARAHAARVAFGWGSRTVHTNVVVGKVAPPGMRTLDSLIGEPVDLPVPANVSPADPAVIAFTTGSTGEPKPTVLRQRNFAALISMVSAQWGIGVESSDRSAGGGRNEWDDGRDVIDMPTFPMFWIIGLSAGGTVVVPPMDFTVHGPGDADPAKLIRTISDCNVSSMFASPALLANLADEAARTGTKLSTLRRIVAGGAEIQGPLFAKVKAVLDPEAEMYSDYGATEALPVSEIDGTCVLNETWPQTESGRGVCVGRPLSGVEVKIIAAHDGNLSSLDDAEVLAVGEIGEIIARSPHISEDYFRSPQATMENKIPDGGWHRIGDTGYLDDQERLWICGRKSHVVRATDSDLYPLRVEPVFNAHPGVARSALVGVKYGRSQVAVVCIEKADRTPTSELEAELLRLAEQFESTSGVERIVFVDRLPVDQRHNAKIDRPLLARELEREWARSGTSTSVSRGAISGGTRLSRMLK